MIKLRNILTEAWSYNAKPDKYFLYPTTETFSRKSVKTEAESLRPYGWVNKSNNHGYTGNLNGGITLGNKYLTDIEQYQKKYGIPTKQEIKADQFIEDSFWKIARKIPSDAYDKWSWYQFGNGASSDMGWVYAGNKKMEFYLRLPREIRHPEEYKWVKDSDIKMFEDIRNEIGKVASKVSSMGFTVTINATPRGFKG